MSPLTHSVFIRIEPDTPPEILHPSRAGESELEKVRFFVSTNEIICKVLTGQTGQGAYREGLIEHYRGLIPIRE